MTSDARAPRPALSRVLVRGAPLALLLAVVGCGGAGLDCGSGCANAYPFPQTAASVPNGTAPVDDGIRMRLTQAGLDFVMQNLDSVLISQFGTAPGQPGVIAIPIGGQTVNGSNPRVNLGFSTTSANGQPLESYPTSILIDANQLEQRLDVDLDDAEDGIRLVIRDLPLGIDARAYADFDFGISSSDAACNVRGGANGIIGTISLDMLIQPGVGRNEDCDEAGGVGECITLDISLASASVGALDIDLSNPGPCSNAACTTGSRVCSDSFPLQADDFECSSACGVGDFALDVIEVVANFLTDTLGFVIRPALETAIRSALEDIDGAPLSVAQRQDVAGFAPGILPASALDLGLSIAPTSGAFEVNNPAGGALGLDLILKSGFEAAPPLDATEGLTVPHPCARPIEGVNFANLYAGAEFEVPDNLLAPLTGSFDGATYHLGASLAKPAVNQILFALYNTGALCLEVDSDAINTLAGGSFQLSAATLDLLTSGKLKQFADAEAPAIVVVNPSQPPVVRYGAGTAEEGHLIIDWPDVEVGFYVLMFERFSRVFAVSADISLQIAVFDDPDTRTLRLSVVNGPNITGFEQTYSELLPGIDFTEVLESLLGTVLDAALGDGLEFNFDIADALSGALGLPIFIDLNGIETVPASDREFLNIYLTMTDTPPQPRTMAPTSLRLADDPGVLRRVEDLGAGRPATLPTGEVRLAVGDDDREYFARADFGLWRGPLRPTDGVITLRDPKLRTTGEHTVTVRSRAPGVPGSLESEGTAVTVWVDGKAPVARLRRVGDTLVASGVDDATVPAGLAWSWQLDDGAWSDFSTTSTLALDDVTARRVAVRAQDLAGNVSRIASVDVGVEQLRRRADREAAPATAAGCAAAGPMTPGAALALVALALLRGRRRR
jgi:uncharacterized protein (TIGR03382 family)